jgi:hypothetical protein
MSHIWFLFSAIYSFDRYFSESKFYMLYGAESKASLAAFFNILLVTKSPPNVAISIKSRTVRRFSQNSGCLFSLTKWIISLQQLNYLICLNLDENIYLLPCYIAIKTRFFSKKQKLLSLLHRLQ